MSRFRIFIKLLFLPIIIFTFSSYGKTEKSENSQQIIESIKLDKTRMIIKPNKDFAETYLLGDFFVEYTDDNDPDFDLRSLDFSIITMPFVMTVMPIIWASNKTYSIASMDQKLAESLEEIRAVFKLFYPSISWSGRLEPKEFKKNQPKCINPDENRTVVLFSGGVDSTYASFVHNDTKQHLFIIKAEKYPPKPKELWEETKKNIAEFATDYGHTFSSARSNWKKFLKNSYLKTMCPNIPKMWWGYTTQALGYAGIAAPVLISKGYTTAVIGATHTKHFPYPWGSHPLVDNKIVFATASIKHIGYEKNRMEKLSYIHQECIQHLKKPLLRVCHTFGYDNRGNCCRCEKCYRTLLDLIALDANLQEYGFKIIEKKAFLRIKKFFEHKPKFTNGLTYHWQGIQDFIKNRLDQKRKTSHEKVEFFEWFCSLNLQDNNQQTAMPIKKINWDTLEYSA